MPITLLRRPQVEAATGLGRFSLYEAIAKGNFPKPVKTGARRVAWDFRLVRRWRSRRLAMRFRYQRRRGPCSLRTGASSYPNDHSPFRQSPSGRSRSCLARRHPTRLPHAVRCCRPRRTPGDTEMAACEAHERRHEQQNFLSEEGSAYETLTFGLPLC
jgi:prophage regulatory protein